MEEVACGSCFALAHRDKEEEDFFAVELLCLFFFFFPLWFSLDSSVFLLNERERKLFLVHAEKKKKGFWCCE